MAIRIIKYPISRAELLRERKERWSQLSLCEQLGNIGSEVHRTALAEGKNAERFVRARDRALELFDLTLADKRWHGRLRELGRAREVFCDGAEGGTLYGTTLAGLQGYFDRFALAKRV